MFTYHFGDLREHIFLDILRSTRATLFSLIFLSVTIYPGDFFISTMSLQCFKIILKYDNLK